MSRDFKSSTGSGLKLTGSPVQLTHRESNVIVCGGGGRRSRPRSAYTRGTVNPETHERSRRPFSAESKSPSSVHNNLRNGGGEKKRANLTQYLGDTIRIGPPTTALLESHNIAGTSYKTPIDLFSNTSDVGSEDTYMSLGTKIKTKAQINSKQNSTNKNYLKYRNIAKRVSNDDMMKEAESIFDFKVTISENTSNNFNYENEADSTGEEENKKFEAYLLSLESKHNTTPDNESVDPLAGRVSFGKGVFESEDQSNDNYYPRLSLSKQQLSLVEEESTQDCDSMPSHPLSSLSPQAPIDKHDKAEEIQENENCNLSVKFAKGDCTPRNNIDKENMVLENAVRTYDSFYDDFTSHNVEGPMQKRNFGLSSTVFSSPGNRIGGGNDCTTTSTYTSTLPKYTKHIIKSIDNNLNITNRGDGEQHSSLECIALENTTESRSHRFPPRTVCQWNERGDGLGDDQSNPCDLAAVEGAQCNAVLIDHTKDTNNRHNDCAQVVFNLDDEYPHYLSNSLSKAYTSKVIEDYKKEIQAIDNLHELTLKDIKIDSISPTPLSLDVMFAEVTDIKKTDNSKLEKYNDMEVSNTFIPKSDSFKKTAELEVANIPTKELIQNYFRVKDEQPKQSFPKTPKKRIDKCNEKKSSGDATSSKPLDSFKSNIQRKAKNVSPIHKRNNILNEIRQMPLSSRIECVQNDKDIDSWMSISVPALECDDKNVKTILDQAVVETNSRKEKENDSDTLVAKAEDKTEIINRVAPNSETVNIEHYSSKNPKKVHEQSTVLDIYTMLKEIESFADNPVISKDADGPTESTPSEDVKEKDNFMEIFSFLEKVEHSANDALSAVTSTAPQTAPKLESLLRLSHTELAQRHITAALQLEERSCCIALLQESLANHKQQMITKISNMEKQSNKNIGKVKQDCEEAIKRHQTFIDQLIKDKKTLNVRIEQLVEERRALEERWNKQTAALEQRYKLELKNQHDRMAAAQQVARQRWVRQKAEKIKELTVKGLEGELREMASRAAAETAQIKSEAAEAAARAAARHAAELADLRETLAREHEAALARERRLASERMERQIVELETAHGEQRARLVSELRAESERAASDLQQRERQGRTELERLRQELEREMEQKKSQLDEDIARQRAALEEEERARREAAQAELAEHKRQAEAAAQVELKRRLQEVAAQHRAERDSEIEKAIESLEAEAQRGRRELQDALRRNKEQYEAELRSLGETERATLRRYQEAQARVRSTEDKCAELESAISQMESKNRTLTDKVATLEGVVSKLESEAAEARAAALADAQDEITRLRVTHEEQMHQLYAKVKVAVARKDSALQALTRSAERAEEKAALLEQRLAQQRKDLLRHK